MAILKTILAACFIILVVVVIMPFIAELQLSGGRFEEAIKTDPFNARYAAEYGNYLFKKSLDVKKKTNLLGKAEVLLTRAVQLNPVNAEYYLSLGQIQTSLFLTDKKNTEWASKAISNFKKAVEFDPNGVYISYSVGYAGLSIWKRLNESEKDFIISRLKYCIDAKPHFARHIYSKLWRQTADFALLERLMTKEEKKNKVKRLNEFKADALKYSNASLKILEKDWSGIAADGVNKYRDGAMFWSGAMNAVILVPPVKSTIKIKAKGTPADRIYPQMIVELDGKMIGETYVRNTEWVDYKFAVNTDGGVKVLSITFVNDGAGKDGREDRNLYIGGAEAT